MFKNTFLKTWKMQNFSNNPFFKETQLHWPRISYVDLSAAGPHSIILFSLRRQDGDLEGTAFRSCEAAMAEWKLDFGVRSPGLDPSFNSSCENGGKALP